jgi:hypothetical protein
LRYFDACFLPDSTDRDAGAAVRLARRDTIERAKNGPLTPDDLEWIACGSRLPERHAQRAENRAEAFEKLARSQIEEVIRPRRAAGNYLSYMRRDLQIYLTERRRWRAEATRLRRLADSLDEETAFTELVRLSRQHGVVAVLLAARRGLPAEA